MIPAAQWCRYLLLAASLASLPLIPVANAQAPYPEKIQNPAPAWPSPSQRTSPAYPERPVPYPVYGQYDANGRGYNRGSQQANYDHILNQLYFNQNEVAALRHALQTLQGAAEDLKQSLSEAREKDTVFMERLRIQETKVDHLGAALNEVSSGGPTPSDLQELEQTLSETRDRNLLLMERLRIQEAKVDHLVAGFNLMKSETGASSAEYQALQDENHSLTSELEELRNQLAERDSSVVTTSQALEEANDTIQDLNRKLEAAAALNEDLSAEHATIRQELETTQQAATSLDSERLGEVARLEELESRLRTVMEERNALQDELKSSHQAAAQSRREVDQLQNQLDEFRRQEAERGARQTSLEDQINQLRIRNEELQAELAINKTVQEHIGEESEQEQTDPPPAAAISPVTVQDEGRERKCDPDIDSDCDGVADPNDLCPDTETGIRIDNSGCRTDRHVILEGVNFRFNSAELTASSGDKLDQVARYLRQNPELRVEIAGHTDNQGAAVYNEYLSRLRAIAVRDYLVEKGISVGRMTAVGYGPGQPVAGNDTVEGLVKNRRVELRRMAVPDASVEPDKNAQNMSRDTGS